MTIELLRGCPDSNGNYSDSGCDDYDRIARMYICDEDGSNCNEIARWITPFDRQPHHLTDISSFISMIRPGGNKIVKFQESGWPNSLLTLKIRLYHGENNNGVQREFLPMRGKLLEVAAALDRLERKDALLLDYPGMDQISKAIEALRQNGQARAETVQKIFSLIYNPDWNTDISGTDS